jgi:hypothetical protein
MKRCSRCNRATGGHMMKNGTFLCMLVFCGVAAAATHPVRLSYVTVGSGVYGVLADRVGPIGLVKDSYYTTLSMTAYVQALGWTVSIGAPAQVTLELYDEKYLSRYGVHPADLSMSIGKRIGRISPKLVFKTPLGYPTSNAVAWISSGNTRAGLGAAADLGRLMNGRISFAADLEALVTVNDTAGYPRFGIGSVGGWGDVKSSIAVTRSLRSGVQAYYDFSIIRYSDWSILPERSITVVPLLSLNYTMGKRVTINGWGGSGAKFTSLPGGSTSRVIIGGIGMGYGY